MSLVLTGDQTAYQYLRMDEMDYKYVLSILEQDGSYMWALVSIHSSTNGALKSRYKKMNYFVYILGRIPPMIFVSSAK